MSAAAAIIISVVSEAPCRSPRRGQGGLQLAWPAQGTRPDAHFKAARWDQAPGLLSRSSACDDDEEGAVSSPPAL